MGHEDQVKPELWLPGLLGLLLVCVTAGNGKNMQEEGVEWIWGLSKLQDLPCHLVGTKAGDHARNVCPLPPHSHPEQIEEQLKRNVTAGLWSGVSLLPVCLENMCCSNS